MIVLGIETSCDETSASIIKNNKVLSNIIYSQSIHSKYGGVVPNLASKDHEKNILEVVKECIESVGARQVLRDLNCEQRRHWLWGIFWYERDGVGMKKLKALEQKWKKEKNADLFV